MGYRGREFLRALCGGSQRRHCGRDYYLQYDLVYDRHGGRRYELRYDPHPGDFPARLRTHGSDCAGRRPADAPFARLRAAWWSAVRVAAGRRRPVASATDRTARHGGFRGWIFGRHRAVGHESPPCPHRRGTRPWGAVQEARHGAGSRAPGER